MAGKRVKCPSCKNPITVPASKAAVASAQAPKAPSASTYNPILDLLDEAGVKSVPTGPVCHNCGTEMHPSSMICIDCGYNMSTGEQLETEVYDDEDDIVDTGRSDAAKIMAKAERDIDETPVTAEGQDFGDGADSFVIAIIAGIGFLILMGIGVGFTLFMDVLVEEFELTPHGISLAASIGMYILCVAWISGVAYLMKPVQGIVCICTGGLYCIVFGFMQGSTLLIPTIVLIVSIVIGLLSYVVGSFTSAEDQFGMLVQSALSLVC